MSVRTVHRSKKHRSQLKLLIGALLVLVAVGGSQNFLAAADTVRVDNQTLTPSTVTSASFVDSIAIDGDTMVVAGSPLAEVAGSVSVFVRSDGMWSEQAQLTTPSAGPGDFFGNSVAVDGDTIVVGAYGDDGVFVGSAYVFVRSGSTWVEQAKLSLPNLESRDFFGASVAVDGDTIVVGATGDDDGAEDAGAAYVFLRSGTTWNEQAKLTAHDAATTDVFGRDVSIDNGTIVVNAELDDIGDDVDAGSVYVFVRSGSTWVEQAKLVESDPLAQGYFGGDVSLDGDTIVIGRPEPDFGDGVQGAAYVFVRSGSTWAEQATLFVPDGERGDGFGYAVSLDGDRVVVGALSNQYPQPAHASYLFERSDSTWDLRATLSPSDPSVTGRRFGIAANIDGGTVAVGSDVLHIYNLASPVFPDFDGDGHTTETDCNDDLATINPDVADGIVVDGVDNNCNGDIDEDYVPDAVTFFADNDADTFGDPDSTEVAFTAAVEGTIIQPEAPEGYVADGTDCDDGNAAVNPAVSLDGPIADGVNNDCDQEIDEDRGLLSEDSKLPAAGTVAVSSDGSTIVVGNSREDAVTVFVASDSTWVEQAVLTTELDPDRSAFGELVLVDGDTIMVLEGGQNSVHWFERSGSTWVEEGVVEGATTVNARSIAIDGDTFVAANSRTEVVHVFQRSGSTWVEQAVLATELDYRRSAFGEFVSVDGDTVMVLEGRRNSVHWFERSGSTWVDEGVVEGTTAVNVQSFALDGDTLVVGDRELGLVHQYSRSGSTWVEQAVLEGEAGAFGDLVAVDNGYIVVGSSDRGDASVFVQSAGEWVESFTLQVSDHELIYGFDRVSVENGVVVLGHESYGQYIFDLTDADRDGVPVGLDCNDNDAATQPGAGADGIVVDGVDNDCDGQVDEDYVPDEVLFFADTDGDTFGDDGSPRVELTAAVDGLIVQPGAPDGFVADRFDCNDGDDSVFPGAAEVPGDGIDQDCDGEDTPLEDEGELGDNETGDEGNGGDVVDAGAETGDDPPVPADDSGQADGSGENDGTDRVLSVTGRVFSDANRNGVADVGEGDISDVVVELYGAGSDATLRTQDDVLLATATTASPFEFFDIADGRYVLIVDEDSLPVGVYASQGGALATEVLVASGTIATVNFAQDYASVSAVLADVDGTPIRNTSVTLTDSSGNVFTATTNGLGEFSIDGTNGTPLLLGDATVQFELNGQNVSISLSVLGVNSSVAELAAPVSQVPPALAFTGAASKWYALLGLLLIVTGASLVAAERRLGELVG